MKSPQIRLLEDIKLECLNSKEKYLRDLAYGEALKEHVRDILASYGYKDISESCIEELASGI